MSGAGLGLLLGIGLACIWWSFWPREERVRVRRPGPMVRLGDEIRQAEIPGLRPAGLLTGVLVLGLLVALIAWAVTGVAPIGVAFGVGAALLPITWVRGRARRRRARLRDEWPDVVDHVGSAIRAGLALPEALAQLADRGPADLRPAFASFAQDYGTTGRFSESLDVLKDRLADPVADRLIEALRLARDVGGSDLGRLLRTLSGFLREEAHSRAELQARQSWTVNAARLALAAPWAVLLMLSTRGESLQAYSSSTGVLVLAAGGAVSVIAYRVMMRIGRLPEEQRVLR